MFEKFFRSHYDLGYYEPMKLFRLKMLKVVILFIALFAFLFSFLDWMGLQNMGLDMRMIDTVFGFLSLIAFWVISRWEDAYNMVVYIVISSAFAIFIATYFLVPADGFRFIWFFILVAMTFMLHSIRLGLLIAFLSASFFILTFFIDGDSKSELGKMTALISLFMLTVASYFYTRRVQAYETELWEKNRELERLATHDSLTGIMNRRLFLSISNKYFHTAKRNDENFFFFMLDIDNFKLINDTYGHHIGDEVLKELTERIASTLRKNDLFGRLGGEEFGIGLVALNLNHAMVAAEKIRRCIADKLFIIEGIEMSVTLSIGVSESQNYHSLSDLMNGADKALYIAKASGRNVIKSEYDKVEV